VRKELIWLLLLAGCSALSVPQRAEFCAVASHPERFAPLTVVTRAEYVDTQVHGDFLSRPNCDRIMYLDADTDRAALHLANLAWFRRGDWTLSGPRGPEAELTGTVRRRRDGRVEMHVERLTMIQRATEAE
jgi:hypothetical protein